jgi:predicted ATPase
MSIKSLLIHGLRGFASAQQLPLAIPNGELGSGLTILVGPNSSGKSTVIEAFRALSFADPPSFTEGRRNRQAGHRVKIRAEHSTSEHLELATVKEGGSESSFTPEHRPVWADRTIFVLPSRRYFAPYFSRSTSNRQNYISGYGSQAQRGAAINHFAYRLFHVQKNARKAFDEVLAEIMSPVPAWSIEQSDAEQHYIKLDVGGAHHSSEGMGEGLISLLFIVDALYDSKESDIIVIDEPELSLHPALQRKVAALINKYSATRQIIIATHSPYFTDFQSLINGGSLSRISTGNLGSIISTVARETIDSISGLLKNIYNPHVLGLNAREVFFLDDGVILTEGQDDVALYNDVAEQVGVKIDADFYGWGVGGADNMRFIAQLLCDLGFKRVAGILDGDRAHMLDGLREEFKSYVFEAIPAKDIRTKDAVKSVGAVEGLLDKKKILRPKYANDTRLVLQAVANATSRAASSAPAESDQLQDK